MMHKSMLRHIQMYVLFPLKRIWILPLLSFLLLAAFSAFASEAAYTQSSCHLSYNQQQTFFGTGYFEVWCSFDGTSGDVVRFSCSSCERFYIETPSGRSYSGYGVTRDFSMSDDFRLPETGRYWMYGDRNELTEPGECMEVLGPEGWYDDCSRREYFVIEGSLTMNLSLVSAAPAAGSSSSASASSSTGSASTSSSTFTTSTAPGASSPLIIVIFVAATVIGSVLIRNRNTPAVFRRSPILSRLWQSTAAVSNWFWKRLALLARILVRIMHTVVSVPRRVFSSSSTQSSTGIADIAAPQMRATKPQINGVRSPLKTIRQFAVAMIPALICSAFLLFIALNTDRRRMISDFLPAVITFGVPLILLLLRYFTTKGVISSIARVLYTLMGIAVGLLGVLSLIAAVITLLGATRTPGSGTQLISPETIAAMLLILGGIGVFAGFLQAFLGIRNRIPKSRGYISSEFPNK